MDLATLTAQIATVSERYADAFGIRRSEEWAVMKLAEELGELTQAHLKRSGQARVGHGVTPAALQQAFEDELADVVGMALVLASVSGVDLGAALTRKWLRWHPDNISADDYAEAARQARGEAR